MKMDRVRYSGLNSEVSLSTADINLPSSLLSTLKCQMNTAGGSDWGGRSFGISAWLV